MPARFSTNTIPAWPNIKRNRMGVFRFKEFEVDDSGCGMKICSDSVLLGAWLPGAYTEARTVADIGAGSGVLSLLCAQCCPAAIIRGVENDAGAAEAARENFARSPWAQRLTLLHDDFGSLTGLFDLIISNPPYFTTGAVSADRARAHARHCGGLGYDTLIAWAREHLTCEGHLGFVSPSEIAGSVIFTAEMEGLKLRRQLTVKTSPRKAPTRILWDFALYDGPVSTETLSLRDADGSPSAQYRALVEPFYIKI